MATEPRKDSEGKSLKLASAVFIAALCFTIGCTKEKREVLTGGGSAVSTGPATLSTIQDDVFRLGCAVSGCHDARPNPAADLSMISAQKTYEEIVGQTSTQVGALKLVLPGDADNSYFVIKLRGTHLSIGGSGDRMPQYAAPLNGGDIERIIDWINGGAILN